MRWKEVLGVALSGLIALQALAGETAGKLNGTWKAVAGTERGKKVPKELLENSDLILRIHGDRYTVTLNGKIEEEGTLKTDTSTKPARIDLKVEKGKHKGKSVEGIYRLDGDTLSISIGRPGHKERPGAFTSKEGSDCTAFVLKRQKDRTNRK